MLRELSQPRPPFIVPEDAQLQDASTLMQHLLEASQYARGSVDGGGFARLLEAAAQLIQQQAAENKVQRGLAIASQTLASELAIKCEQLQFTNGAAAPDLSPHQSPRTASAPPPQQVTATPLMGRSAGPSGLPQMAQPSPTGGLPVNSVPNNSMAGGGATAVAPVAEEPAPIHHRTGSNTWVEGSGSDRQWQYDAGVKRQGGNATYTGHTREGRDALGGATPGLADSEEERQVDAMVLNLKQRFKQSKVTLPLEKHQGTVYRLGSRKLQLSIRNSRLMVRVGSTYCDFLEYLSKAAL